MSHLTLTSSLTALLSLPAVTFLASVERTMPVQSAIMTKTDAMSFNQISNMFRVLGANTCLAVGLLVPVLGGLAGRLGS